MLDEREHEPAPKAASLGTQAPGPLVATETRPESDGIVIAVSGELDMATAPALRSRLLELLASPISALTVDCDGIEFLDSAGLTALMGAAAAAEEIGVQFKLVQASRQARLVIEIAGLTEALGLTSPESDDEPDDTVPSSAA